MAVLGIDISKRDFHAHLLDDKREAKKSFPNSAVGFAQLDAWLEHRRAKNVQA